MKDFAHKLIEFFMLDHVIIAGIGLVAALMSSAKNDVGSPVLVRFLNVLTGFLSACLSGYILHEIGWAVWFSSGGAYLGGLFGNRIMNIILNVLKQAEIDPFSTVGKIIGLIWSFKLPKFGKSNGDQS